MAVEIDYLPVATGGSALVDTQANFAGSGYQVNGFSLGIALPAQANKVWRQASMMAAALANYISNTLGINVLDDGNLPALIANLTNAIFKANHYVDVTQNSFTPGPGTLNQVPLPAGALEIGSMIRVMQFFTGSAGTYNFKAGATSFATVTLTGGLAISGIAFIDILVISATLAVFGNPYAVLPSAAGGPILLGAAGGSFAFNYTSAVTISFVGNAAVNMGGQGMSIQIDY